MDETQIDKAEQLLSYFEHHGEAMTYGPEAVHREWWMGEAAGLLRDMLPEWSAFREAEPAAIDKNLDRIMRPFQHEGRKS